MSYCPTYIKYRKINFYKSSKRRIFYNLPFLISIFYKYTHIAITFENFSGSYLKCLGAHQKKTDFSVGFFLAQDLNLRFNIDD